MEQLTAADAGDEEIGAAVVIVVPDGDAHAVEGGFETRGGGDVFEVAGAVVLVEAKTFGGGLAVGMPGPEAAVDEDQILVAVGVEVEEGHASAHGFRE